MYRESASPSLLSPSVSLFFENAHTPYAFCAFKWSDLWLVLKLMSRQWSECVSQSRKTHLFVAIVNTCNILLECWTLTFTSYQKNYHANTCLCTHQKMGLKWLLPKYNENIGKEEKKIIQPQTHAPRKEKSKKSCTTEEREKRGRARVKTKIDPFI